MQEDPKKVMDRIEHELIPAIVNKMNSVIASANLLKNTKGSNKRIANGENQH